MSGRTGNTNAAGNGGPRAPAASVLLLPPAVTTRFTPEPSRPPAPLYSLFSTGVFPAEFGDRPAPADSVFSEEGADMANVPRRVPGGRTIWETAADGLTPMMTRSPGFTGATAPAGLPVLCPAAATGLATITAGAGSSACDPNAVAWDGFADGCSAMVGALPASTR